MIKTAKACLAGFALALLAQSGFAQSIEVDSSKSQLEKMIFRNGATDVFIKGEIGADTPDKFEKFITDRNIQFARVHFDSDGGSLLGAMRLGRFIRAKLFDTAVGAANDKPGVCASACAYAFAGGQNRYYSGGDSRLGVHRFYATADVGDDATQLMNAVLLAYLREMEVDPELLIYAAAAGRSEITWLDRPTAERLKLANNGTLATTAELRAEQMTPYLRLEQIHANGDMRLLLLCDAGRLHVMAGVVTDEDTTAMRAEVATVSYLEFTNLPGSPRVRADKVEPSGSVLWINSTIDRADAARMLGTDEIAVWTENGAMRFGQTMEIASVRAAIKDYVQDCQALR